MAIIPPRLDDRAFEDLRAELIRRIPIHAPEWTDHNASDPGIALIELFAALGDNLLYRFNRVPEAARLQFLRLLAIPPRPALAALAQVRLDLPPNAVDPVTPEFSTGLPRLTLAAGEIQFQAQEEVTALPVELRCWAKQGYSGPLLPGGVENVTTLLADHLGGAPALAQYEAVPLPPPEGGVLPPGLSSAASVDDALWLCLLAPEKAIKALTTGDDAAALAALRARIAGQVINLGVRTDDNLCGATDHARCPDPGTDPPRWPLLWEISTGRFSGAARRVDRVVYQRLSPVSDGTDGLTRGGTVRLRLPSQNPDGTLPFGDWTADSFDDPDPDLLGVGALPPRLDDEGQVARVLAWIRVSRRDPLHPPIRLRWIDANVVQVEQAVTAAPELLAYGDGRTAQRFVLAHTPVLTGSEQVQVRGVQGWENWRRVDDLAEAGPDDPFYSLDPAEGALGFGDGIHGRIPLPGEAVRVLTYRLRRRCPRQRRGRSHHPGAWRLASGPGPEAHQSIGGTIRRGRGDPGGRRRPYPQDPASSGACGGRRGLCRPGPGDPRYRGRARPGVAPAQAPRAGGRGPRHRDPDRAARLRPPAPGPTQPGPGDAAPGL